CASSASGSPTSGATRQPSWSRPPASPPSS
ncbi:MAG: hypothetical protein AVDCRST_MAG50-2211, partial [uncultured Acidimicrobiales bacterium]